MKSMKCWTARLGGSEAGDSEGKTSANSRRKDGSSLSLVSGSFVRIWIAQTGALVSTPLRNWRVVTILRNCVGAAGEAGVAAFVVPPMGWDTKGCHTCLVPPK